MAYSNDTPASLTDLITDLRAFAVANAGFTDPANDYTASGTKYFSLTKGGIHYGFAFKDASGGGDVQLNTSTAWAGSGLLTAQTGAHSVNARSYTGLTPLEYWFFADSDCVHAVVEISADCYAHFSFGKLTKAGAYTGGEYVCANHWNSTTWTSSQNSNVFSGYGSTGASYQGHIRVTYNAKTIAVLSDWTNSAVNCAVNLFWNGGYYNAAASANDEGLLVHHQPNTYNGRAVLIPVEFFMMNVTGSLTAFNGWIPLGRINNAAIVAIDNLDAGDLVNTDWMVFPLCMKNPQVSISVAAGQVDTYNFGLAYKK